MTDKKKKRPTSDRHKDAKNLRIPEALYNELKAVAKVTDRPLHWEARRALRNHIRETIKRLEADGLWPPPEDSD